MSTVIPELDLDSECDSVVVRVIHQNTVIDLHESPPSSDHTAISPTKSLNPKKEMIDDFFEDMQDIPINTPKVQPRYQSSDLITQLKEKIVNHI